MTSTSSVSFVRVAVRGLIYHWRVNASVALGVAAATAVLTGALLVGDSMRGSLRDMTLDRLGAIDELLFADRFFREELAAELASQPEFQEHYAHAVGTMLFPQGTVQRRDETGVSRSTNVLIVGSHGRAGGAGRASFWGFQDDTSFPSRPPGLGQIILNRNLADEIGAQVGDEVTVRLPKPENLPADSPLGEKIDRIRSIPGLKVIEIIPTKGLGRFSLRPSQTLPSNAYVALEQLQDALRQPGRINAILVSGKSTDRVPGPAASESLASALHPTLADHGLILRRYSLDFTGAEGSEKQVVYDYFGISSDRMILPPEVEEAASAAFGKEGGQRVFTYLANLIEKAGEKASPDRARLPYSMVTAIDWSAGFQLNSIDQKPIPALAEDEIVLTDWAANDLGVQPGDTVRLRYFEPETAHGESVERATLMRIRDVTPLTQPTQPYLPKRQLKFDQRPTLANDPNLTPEVEGITDQRTIDQWEVPFTIDYKRIRPQDDRYWEDFGTTPKAYVSLATGRRLWGSRFGQATSYRIPARDGLTRAEVDRRLSAQLSASRATLGFDFMPIKRLQIKASAGTTPFDGLFLMLSFFIIAAAVLLVALLFRLGFEQRAGQFGLLLALGWRKRRVRRLLVAEGAGVAGLGGILGVVVGLGYAGAILAALRSKSWWLGAITTPFLEFHWTWRSLLIGYAAGVLVSVITIYWSVFQTRRVPARQLLTGHLPGVRTRPSGSIRIVDLAAGALVVIAISLAVTAVFLSGQPQAGAFVGSGATILAAILLWVWNRLRSGARSLAPITGNAPLVKLAARSAARNPARSTLTLGLIATASFLIVAMSAFQLKPTATGTGGFTLITHSSQPIFADLNTEQGRDELLGDDARQLADCQVFAFRVRPGDDASCGNLYRANQPRILGVPESFVTHFDVPDGPRFVFSSSAADSDAEYRNPWQLLASGPTPQGEPIPVVIDKETAMYSLQRYGGIGEILDYSYDGRKIRFRVVGLLALSVLHGNLLISEADFRQLFPDISGYRYSLIKTPGDKRESVARLLEDKLGDQGLDATPADRVLAGLMALQNTYLRTFQSLGALGLLLGTFGLAAVQLRSVLERRGEMGLLRAAGFRRARLAQLVMMENVMLLLAGLATGVVAALLSVLPHMFGGGAAVPLGELALVLGIVLGVGILTGLVTAQATLRVPVLEALREER